jgi:outer membrane protein OmpA-like peptidoglycan-associated protein
MMRWSLFSVCVATIAILGACAPPRQYVRLDPSTIDPPDVRMNGDYVTIDQSIHFALDSDEILPVSSDILDHLAQFLVNHQADFRSMRIIGHADAQGGHEHNQQLSERRATAVRAALVARGVTLRLDPSGQGDDQGVCTEDTEECHQRNRRVEFLFVR